MYHVKKDYGYRMPITHAELEKYRKQFTAEAGEFFTPKQQKIKAGEALIKFIKESGSSKNFTEAREIHKILDSLIEGMEFATPEFQAKILEVLSDYLAEHDPTADYVAQLFQKLPTYEKEYSASKRNIISVLTDCLNKGMAQTNADPKKAKSLCEAIAPYLEILSSQHKRALYEQGADDHVNELFYRIFSIHGMAQYSLKENKTAMDALVGCFDTVYASGFVGAYSWTPDNHQKEFIQRFVEIARYSSENTNAAIAALVSFEPTLTQNDIQYINYNCWNPQHAIETYIGDKREEISKILYVIAVSTPVEVDVELRKAALKYIENYGDYAIKRYCDHIRSGNPIPKLELYPAENSKPSHKIKYLGKLHEATTMQSIKDTATKQTKLWEDKLQEQEADTNFQRKAALHNGQGV